MVFVVCFNFPREEEEFHVSFKNLSEVPGTKKQGSPLLNGLSTFGGTDSGPKCKSELVYLGLGLAVAAGVCLLP